MSREIMQQALEALRLVGKYTDSLTCYASTISEHEANIVDPSVQLAIAALEAELAKPEQEPFKPDWVSYRQGVADGAAQTEHNHLNDAMSVLADVNADLIKEAKLAQPEQEPVAWVKDGVLWNSDLPEKFTGCLYTAPPKPKQESISTNDHLCAMLRQVHDVLACTALPMKREWVGLTGLELNHIFAANVEYPERMCRAIEAKLKEKNGAT